MNDITGGRHCYPGTNVLINKYHIHDGDILEKLEIQKVAIKLLSLDLHPQKVKATFDVKHLKAIHDYLFGDLYEWAGEFRHENFYKSERILSGGSAEYANHEEIEGRLKKLLSRHKRLDWQSENDISRTVSEFLLELWSIHHFREGNTRTCITFLWHYLKAREINFQVELLRNSPRYVRDALVMANYGMTQYLTKIISDALEDSIQVPAIGDIQAEDEKGSEEQYQISKFEYELFKEKYRISKK
jgi:cell filamentation protein